MAATPRFIAYGPVDSGGFTPDVVLIAAKPAQAMLIYEASIKAGASTGLANALGRPACAVLPLTISTGQTSISLGCRGNRTFTALTDNEMYVIRHECVRVKLALRMHARLIQDLAIHREVLLIEKDAVAIVPALRDMHRVLWCDQPGPSPLSHGRGIVS